MDFTAALAGRRCSFFKIVPLSSVHATEAAQSVNDKAVQIFGGLGVIKGIRVEQLYREISALRIYESTTEVQ
jgi:acyl-CoA dehydrogenase